MVNLNSGNPLAGFNFYGVPKYSLGSFSQQNNTSGYSGAQNTTPPNTQSNPTANNPSLGSNPPILTQPSPPANTMAPSLPPQAATTNTQTSTTTQQGPTTNVPYINNQQAYDLGKTLERGNEAAWSQRMGSSPGGAPMFWALAGGGAGLAGNLIQMGLMRSFKPDYKEIQGGQAQMQQDLMDKYLPYMTTNRLGQFGGQAAIEAQRRSAEGSYSVPALANMARANASAAQLEGLSSLMGSQAVQAAQRQARNTFQQLRNMAPGSPAALSALARNAAAGGGDAVAQAMQNAMAQAGQNIAQAGNLRTGATQTAEQAAQRVYETYKRPAETQTDLDALQRFVQTPMTTGLQIGEQQTIIPGNPLEALGNTMAQNAQMKYWAQMMEEARKPGISGAPKNKPSHYSGVNDIVGTDVGDAVRATINQVGRANLKDFNEREIYEQDPNKDIYRQALDWINNYEIGSGQQQASGQTPAQGQQSGGVVAGANQNLPGLMNTINNPLGVPPPPISQPPINLPNYVMQPQYLGPTSQQPSASSQGGSFPLPPMFQIANPAGGQVGTTPWWLNWYSSVANYIQQNPQLRQQP